MLHPIIWRSNRFGRAKCAPGAITDTAAVIAFGVAASGVSGEAGANHLYRRARTAFVEVVD